MVAVEFEGVTKRYGDTVAVEAVSFRVEKGELFFLLGPSGCGKTTILRMTAGFLTPDGGDILFDGRSIVSVPAHKRNTGMVFQTYALWPHMTVAENVAYGLRERNVGREERERRVTDALRTVRMEQLHDRMPNQLSGGQQQRVALARALVIEPDVVLLDEPLSNLDARLRLDMRDEIRRIHEETGITMIYVTHDQKEALSMAGRVAVMDMGSVQQVGTPRAIYRRPANRFVAQFVGETNMLSGTLRSVVEENGVVETALGELRAVLPESPPAEGDPVLCMVRPESLRLGPGEQNTVSARVADSVYLGELEQFLLTAGDLRLRAVRANPADAPPERGREVQVHFDPADAVIIADQESGSS